MDKKILLICLIAIVAFSISCVSAADSNEIVMNSSDAIGISEDISVDDIIHNFDELASKLDWAYEHRDEIRERKQKNLQYSKECWQRHLDRLARREAHEKKIAEIKARKEAEKPKRKRQRIVRYEKV